MCNKIDARTRRARKEHRCWACHRLIQPREKYRIEKYTDIDVGIYELKICLPCHEITEQVFDYIEVAGSYWATQTPAASQKTMPNGQPTPTIPTRRKNRPTGRAPGSPVMRRWSRDFGYDLRLTHDVASKKQSRYYLR